VSHILLATDSKMGIFGIFPKEEQKFVTFIQNGNSRKPCYKRDNKGKSCTIQANLVSLMQPYPVNLKVMTRPIQFCAFDKNESVLPTFSQ